jgi:deoxyribose-phosphate aldolase
MHHVNVPDLLIIILILLVFFFGLSLTEHQSQAKATPLSQYIDHTVLKPEATEKDIAKMCDEAKQHNFAAVCVNGCRVEYCKTALQGTVAQSTICAFVIHVELSANTNLSLELSGTDVKTAAVVGFPLGADDRDAKTQSAAVLVAQGVNELDMVLNVGKFKDRDYYYVHKDIAHLVGAARANHRTVVVKVRLPKLYSSSCNTGVLISEFGAQVILETCLLSLEEIIDASILSVYSLADFVKTSTGFGKDGAKAEHVRAMKLTVGNSALVKASGGVRSLEDAVKMINNGASRIGTSNGVAIVTGGNATQSY